MSEGIVAVTGASGLIGSALIHSLRADGVPVLRLVRHQPVGEGEAYWDPEAGELNPTALAGVTAVVHLAGESFSGRWTLPKKEAILQSRLRGTNLLARTLAALPAPAPALVMTSAVGYYGNRGDQELTEESGPGKGYLSDVCVRWEAAAQPACEAGVRVGILRLGVVLAAHGGAFPPLLSALKSGVGGMLGSGQQWMPWVSLEDVVRALRWVLDTPAANGVFNVVAPETVTNQKMTETLGRLLGHTSHRHITAFMVKLALGEAGESLLLSSMKVTPRRLPEAGFVFAQPQLETVLREALGAE